MKPAGCFLTFLFCFFCLWAGAQQPVTSYQGSNLRVRSYVVKGDSLLLDTLSIVPGSVKVELIPASSYHLDPAKALLYWKSKPASDSIRIEYRVFPFLMTRVQQRLVYDSAVSVTAINPANVKRREQGLFNFGNLQYGGSFSRGIAFGNNQDAVVQSNFNLQLNGLLADSIELAAALSDNNLPLQPDGSTRQLNEFDQVLLQFRKKNWQLNLGDLDLRQDELYFLNFYKRLQGVTFQTTQAVSKRVISQSLVSGSIAKGKFTRNVFQGLEGNQGPYRLNGANGELFFMVLANTERVWVDGTQLQRGEDADYVINYNTAELTFMPRRMITKDSRIQVEFEYADRNYLNANLYTHQKVSIGDKLKVQVGMFSNNDAKNAPIHQPLSPDQKQFLYFVGDSIQQAFYPNIMPDTLGKDKVLYEKVWMQNGTATDSFYRYSTDPALARYALSFSDMGAGKGNYLPDFNGTNGKVFRYVAPVNGVKQGRFEPVQLLVTPKKQQLLSLGAVYSPNKNHALEAEAAVSYYDPNTLSSRNQSDNAAMAAKIAYRNTMSLGSGDRAKMASTVIWEHVQARFRPIERLRGVEFSREWGLPILLNGTDEDIVKVGTSLINKEKELISYQFTSYQRGDGYQGTQNRLQQIGNLKGWEFNNGILLTRYAYQGRTGSYVKPLLNLQKKFAAWGGWQAAFRYEQERNKVMAAGKDSLASESFAFETISASLQTGENWINRYALQFFTRADQLPSGTKLNKTDRSYNVNFQAELLRNQHHQLVLNTTYRELKVLRPDITNLKNDRTLLGRAEYQVNEWSGLLTGNLLYELGTGQEQRRDFTFIEVPAGQGEYAWFDYNKDGVQQLNEFEVAQFRDQARFLRVLVPSNDFVKAAFTTFNYNINLHPKALWSSQEVKGLKKALTRFMVQSSLQTSRKSAAGNQLQLNPFSYDLLDTALISMHTAVGNTLSFNRSSSVWGIDLASFKTTAKALLTYGYESRISSEWNLKARWVLAKSLSMDLHLRQGSQGLFTPVFANRNYDVDLSGLEPKITFLNGTAFRVQASYKYEKKQNAAHYGGQRSAAHALTLDTKYNVMQNSSVSGRFVFNQIAYNDLPNTPIAYSMLDGLLPGKNFLWNLELTKRLINNVEINFTYDGRQPAKAKTIHTGRASLRALF